MTNSLNSDTKIAVVGLGYVGLPLLLAFARHFRCVGFDLSQKRVKELQEGIDVNEEFNRADILEGKHSIAFTESAEELRSADFIIVTVPTPIDEAKQPNLEPLRKVSQTIGKNIKPGCTVVFESTVYPGVTEGFCLPIIEKYSGLKNPHEFKVAYSPERINPGDKSHTVENIVKVVAAQDAGSLASVSDLYKKIITAGVYEAESIRVAEAAKVIENTQRDLNISLMNELAIIFNKMEIDTHAVLRAAGTKWNFLPFTPGLVGGHCIGVDPYYLTHKAEKLGYHPQVILAGRRINDGMGKYIAEQTVKQMIRNSHTVYNAKVLLLGITFKENCNDIRNSRVIDVVRELQNYGTKVYVFDPKANNDDVKREYGISLSDWRELSDIGGVVAAVPHDEIRSIDLRELKSKCDSNACFIDVKSIFEKSRVYESGFNLWRL